MYNIANMLTILYTYFNVTHNRSVGEIDGRPLFDTLITFLILRELRQMT